MFNCRTVLIVSTGLLSWQVMQIVHELGHVLHAWWSGGTVTAVVLHPLALSRTDVSPNPSPHFVAWGGAVWGVLLPIAAWAGARRLRLPGLHVFAFLAGFCLIANGAYLGCGVWYPAGDAADLIDLGTPAWVLGSFGVATVGAGFCFWNGLGKQFGIGNPDAPPQRRLAILTAGLVVGVAMIQVLLAGNHWG
jgi:hypothetical protein